MINPSEQTWDWIRNDTWDEDIVKNPNKIIDNILTLTYYKLAQLMIFLLFKSSELTKSQTDLSVIFDRLKNKLTPDQTLILPEILKTESINKCPHTPETLTELLKKDYELGQTLTEESTRTKESILYLQISNLFPTFKKKFTPLEKFKILEELDQISVRQNHTKDETDVDLHMLFDLVAVEDRDIDIKLHPPPTVGGSIYKFPNLHINKTNKANSLHIQELQTLINIIKNNKKHKINAIKEYVNLL